LTYGIRGELGEYDVSKRVRCRFAYVIIREHIETAHDFDIGTLLWYRRCVSQYAFARVGILCSLQRGSNKRIELRTHKTERVSVQLTLVPMTN
jgi:hypothetical protein